MIRNKKILLRDDTCVEARKLMLESLEAALLAADPKKSVKSHVKVVNNTLEIVREYYPLDKFDHIYVIGAGKASGYMAEALNEILGNKISDGLVIIPDNIRARLYTGNIALWYGTHPIPSEKGVKGTNKIIELVNNATPRDLVICLISGGGSALMPLPYKGITIAQKQKITGRLLRAGATIEEINAVRKHISAIKGGRLAERLSNTTLVSLLISDVVGDKLDTIASGPTVPDSTTFADAMQVLKKHNLWRGLDRSVKNVIERGVSGDIPETPKPDNDVFRNVRNVIIGNNEMACEAAMDYLVGRGFDATILTTFAQGEAREVGTVMASIARQINHRLYAKPVAIVVGGETTVTVKGKGRGGRNQEIVLSATKGIDGLNNVAIASIGTDGIDGNSTAAGAIADSTTLTRAHKKKIRPMDYLANNDSNTFFKKLDDIIETGPTGTNVNDILVMVCM